LHIFQQHGSPKNKAEMWFCVHTGQPVAAVSFCAYNIVLILLSVWVMPLMLLFCWVGHGRFVSKTVVNFVGFGVIGGEFGLADFEGG
jgi:hypothetical protein